MSKPKFPGMQHLSWKIFCRASCIDFIAEHWVTKVMKMHTNLMGASAMQTTFDQARLISRANDAILSFGWASAR